MPGLLDNHYLGQELFEKEQKTVICYGQELSRLKMRIILGKRI
jgi:hypothetical protein